MDPDSEQLLQRLQKLAEKVDRLGEKAVKGEQKERAQYAARCVNALASAVIEDRPIFHVEAWHPLHRNLALNNAGEMLLRLIDKNGSPLPPYPAIMTFYGNGMTEELDTILCLCALHQFRRQKTEKQVSINISGRSLQNKNFTDAVLARLEAMNLVFGEKVILEIHESNAVGTLDRKVIAEFRKLGVAFAMDDVGLSISDIMRLAIFEDVADFIKLDRATVNANANEPHALKPVMEQARKVLPRALMVAEGIQNARHALEVAIKFPEIKYVQGMNLPDRETFKAEWQQQAG